MEKKFKLTSIKINFIGRTLYRIEALKSFGDVKKGDLGGFVETEENLSQYGTSWIYDNAKVTDNAVIYGNAKVCGYAQIYDYAEIYDDAIVHDGALVGGNAEIYGNAKVTDNAIVHGYTRIYDNAQIFNKARVGGEATVFENAKIGGYADLHGYVQVEGDAVIMSDKDFIVFKNFWSSGRYFTWTRSNNMWSVGCFYGTGEELVKKAYKDSEKSGREYERVVRYAESILKDEANQDNQETSAVPYDWEVVGTVKPALSRADQIYLKKLLQTIQKTKSKIKISFKCRPDIDLIKGYWKLIKAWRNK